MGMGSPAMVESVRPRRGEGIPTAGLILLGGSVRETDLSVGIGRSILDLPLGFGRTILGRWLDQAGALGRALGAASVAVRVMVSGRAPLPAEVTTDGVAQVRVERDERDLAGTGGVLRDACRAYGAEEWVLVGHAREVLTEPLPTLVETLLQCTGDVRLLSRADGTPVGLMLARCGVLASIRGTAYVDLKEQALPELSGRFDVRVATTTAASIGVRTLEGYLEALRTLHRQASGAEEDPFEEDWYRTFEIVEDGASVHPSATIHDSVVLRGGLVEEGAVVVRSVVGPGGVVRRGEAVSDTVVAPGARAR